MRNCTARHAALIAFCTILFGVSEPAAHAADILPVSAVSAVSATTPAISVLSPEDAARYRTIFALEDKAAFTAADREISQLSNMLLMGHVLYARFMHPTYRARYDELYRWLKVYGDHPGAPKVYTMAIKRKPKGAKSPQRPEPRIWRQLGNDAPERLSLRRSSASVERIAAHVRSLVRDERPTQALDYLARADVKKVLSTNEIDDSRVLIANSYLAEGKDREALSLAAEIAGRNRREAPLADWTAGLAAWRLGEHAQAAVHFEALSASRTVPTAARAAGAFWAARAYLATKQPARVTSLLEIAADAPRSFYGVLARRQLGRPLAFDWRVPGLDEATFKHLVAIPAVERSIALVEAGQRDLAEEELSRVQGGTPRDLDYAFLALADRLALPAIALQVAECIPEGYDGGRYPVPNFVPAGGFTIDPALLYAFMHQESKFRTGASSHAGAQGLMQLMPRTASHVTGDRTLIKRERDRLLDPSFNLAIAQSYIHDLMENVEPEGNLFMLAVAYNGGPGNLKRWREKLAITDDPLLFIESIPSAETRGYIERVLTNYWAYRDRLGKPSATLDQTAAGKWPVYDPRDIAKIQAN